MTDPPAKQDPSPTELLAWLAGTRRIECYRPPKLSILHLFIWIGLAAVVLSALMVSIQAIEGPGRPSELGVLGTVLLIVLDVVAATLFLGAGVILLDKRRGRPGFLQPGHWLVLVLSLICLWGLAFTFILFWVNVVGFVIAVVYILHPIGPLAGAAIALRGMSVHDTRHWQRVLGLLSGVLAIAGIAPILACVLPFSIVFGLVAVGMWFAMWIALLAAIRQDRREGTRRDGLHWLGVGMLAFFWLGFPLMALLVTG